MAAIQANGVPREEIRFGVVLNGGVSLAVWIGGTVTELDRLIKAGPGRPRGTHPPSPVYRALLALAGSTARADVIAGTSAGGINGAALALAQVNRSAQMSSLRDIWVDQGRIESLLRQPFKGSPTSLLKGDEFFLPELNKALSRLAEAADTVSPEDAPIDLSITTTVLGGNQTVTVDSMGQQLPQRLHAGRFRWQRYPGPDSGPDPFDGANIARTADRMALAARSTASFPIAFEPSFVPVNSPKNVEPEPGAVPTEEQRLHPDMTEVVEEWGDSTRGRDRSRFVVDGGLLANTPSRQALQAVQAMPASGPVRRVMLLIYPHAESPGADPAAVATEAPTVAGTVAGLMDALTAQGGRTFVDELEEHNKVAAGRRGTRGDIVRGYQDPAELEKLAKEIFPQYRQIRLWRSARDLAARATGRSGDDSTSVLPAGWNYERVRRAAQKAQSRWESPSSAGGPVARHPVPYVPMALARSARRQARERQWAWGTTTALGIAEAAGDLLRRLIWELKDEGYQDVHDARKEVSRLAGRLTRWRDEQDGIWESGTIGTLQPSESYWTLRLAAYERFMLGTDDRDSIDRLIEAIGVAEAEAVMLAAPGSLGRSAARKAEVVKALTKAILDDPEPGIANAWPEIPETVLAGGPGQVGRAVKQDVLAVVKQVCKIQLIMNNHVRAGMVARDQDEEELLAWRQLLGPGPSKPETVLNRLLQLEIAATTLGDEVRTGLTLPLEVVQLSAQTRNAFAQFTLTGNDKLGGMSVNRFGGFLKRSWRVNDWTWGRIDAATMLCRIVLHPARVRRTAHLSGYLDRLRELLPGLDPAAYVVELSTLVDATVTELVDELFPKNLQNDGRIRDLRVRAVRELTKVFDLRTDVEDLDVSLPALADLFAWALQLEVVPGEMPALARAIRADAIDGANARSRGALFLAENETLLAALEARDRAGAGQARPTEESPAEGEVRAAENWAALGAFDRGGIGGEPLADEGSSDQMIRTATTAAAVAATVIDSSRSGLGAVKVVTRPLRGALLVPFWVIMGLSSKSVLARSLALLGLALGGALLVLSLFGVLPETLTGPAVALGSGAVLAAFAFGAMRSGTLLHGLVLLSPVIPLVVHANDQARRPAAAVDPAQPAAAEQGVGVLAVILALVLALMILGSLPATTGSVLGALDRLADRRNIPAIWASRGMLARVLGALLRRSLGLLVTGLRLLTGVVLVSVAVILVRWLLSGSWQGHLSDAQDNLDRLTSLAVVAVGVGALVAYGLGRALQVIRPTIVPDESGTMKTVTRWRFQPLTHPAGAVAGWAVLYGAGYLVLARVLVTQDDWLKEDWVKAALLTATGLGAILVLVVPVVLPVLAIARLYFDELRRGLAPTEAVPRPAEDDSEALEEYREKQARDTAKARKALAMDMTARGVSYRCFVAEPSRQLPADPRLRGLGGLLYARLVVRQEKDARQAQARREAQAVRARLQARTDLARWEGQDDRVREAQAAQAAREQQNDQVVREGQDASRH